MSFIDEKEIAAAMSVKLDFDVLPEKATFQEGIRRAPDRGFRLTQAQTEIALKNALRYIPKKFHQELIPEFLGPRGEVIVWAVIHFIEGISVLYPEFKVGIVLSTPDLWEEDNKCSP